MTSIDNALLPGVMDDLREIYSTLQMPLITEMEESRQTGPFEVLFATVLSLRTKDTTTIDAAQRLFDRYPDAPALMEADEALVRELIYPVGFYKRKAGQIIKIARILVEQYGGEVPDDLEVLLSLPGVGRKTANLVLAKGYGIDAVCVDTHVHRILNRWGYLMTKTPEKTEMYVRAHMDRKYWIELNDILVAYGQNICGPISPLCSKCPITDRCPRLGVKYSR